MANIVDSYFSWLCDLIEVNQESKSYWLLANALHQKNFYWSVPNDDNRAFEGRNLREKFCEEHRIEYHYDDFPEQVSMLEVVIGLAYRCESIMVDEEQNMEMSQWFWKIMSNVNLDLYTDVDYYDLNGQVEVSLTLNRIIERTYQRSGKGGLFPLKHSREDQRKVELWYQMNTYLVEKYYSNGAV